MKNTRKISLANNLQKVLPEQAFVFSQQDLESLKSFGAVALAVIGVAGVVAAAVAAPNILQIAKHIPKLRKALRKSNKPAKNIAQTFYYLKRQNYIKFTKSGDDYIVEITVKGKKRLQKISFSKIKVPRQKKWDGGWWIILADIPKDFRYQADLLRQKVKDLGFYLMQRTVWVYPFDPRREIAFIAAYYGVGRFTTVIKTAWVDPQDEAVLKKYFNIK